MDGQQKSQEINTRERMGTSMKKMKKDNFKLSTHIKNLDYYHYRFFFFQIRIIITFFFFYQKMNHFEIIECQITAASAV